MEIQGKEGKQKVQFVLDFDTGFADSYGSCREFIQARVSQLAVEQRKQQKAIAADMDMAPSCLTRKLAGADSDKRRFTLDDFERYLETQRDMKPLYYLIEKYLSKTDEAALLRQIEALQSQLQSKKGKN